MEKIKLTPKQLKLIERMGVTMEHSGMPPAQARISALLLVCDEAELTFNEIVETLKISKSAASNAINSLLLMERIEYHTKPGDRKRYFSSRIGQIECDFEKNSIKLLEVKTLLEEILNSRTTKTIAFNTNLKKVINFMEFLEKELPELYKKWREIKN